VIKVTKLGRPTKRSGYELAAGQTTTVRGLVLTNKNNFSVYVDKFTLKKRKKK
jgi:hypothetical protein